MADSGVTLAKQVQYMFVLQSELMRVYKNPDLKGKAQAKLKAQERVVRGLADDILGIPRNL